MRVSTVAALLALASMTRAAAGQEPRFGIEITGGKTTSTAIYDHSVSYSAAVSGFTARERTTLTIGNGTTAGIRVLYRLTGGWHLSAEADRGHTTYFYDEDYEAIGSDVPGIVSRIQAAGNARRTAYGMSVGHRAWLFGTPLFMSPELGASVQQLRVGADVPVCLQPQPPSAGGPTLGEFPCSMNRPRWERTYTVPSASGAMTLGYRLARRATVHVRGQYWVGRANTADAFWEDLIPALDYAEAPKSRTIRTTRLSAGICISP
jgi:hypothetical protein